MMKHDMHNTNSNTNKSDNNLKQKSALKSTEREVAGIWDLLIHHIDLKAKPDVMDVRLWNVNVENEVLERKGIMEIYGMSLLRFS